MLMAHSQEASCREALFTGEHTYMFHSHILICTLEMKPFKNVWCGPQSYIQSVSHVSRFQHHLSQMQIHSHLASCLANEFGYTWRERIYSSLKIHLLKQQSWGRSRLSMGISQLPDRNARVRPSLDHLYGTITVTVGWFLLYHHCHRACCAMTIIMPLLAIFEQNPSSGQSHLCH